jgi:hypothetical protein
MGDITPSSPVRIEPSSSGEDRDARERRPLRQVKPLAAARHEDSPDVDVDFGSEDLNRDDKHKLDERA